VLLLDTVIAFVTYLFAYCFSSDATTAEHDSCCCLLTACCRAAGWSRSNGLRTFDGRRNGRLDW